jgi:predicted enzyme related to lactoylglutathione lyase
MSGQIGWIDLTVPDAPALRDFYRGVTGWTPASVQMGDYQDFCMHPPGAPQPVAGICHARGQNLGLPPVWLIYITVDDLDQSIRRCRELCGKVLRAATAMGPNGRFCVIEDPAGAICALYQPVAISADTRASGGTSASSASS